jgi:predicted SprT family Zn-dependent metalloprotease
MKKQQRIVYSEYGLANVYSDKIELNKSLKLKKYKVLRDYIIKHELEHKINSFDLMHEFKIDWKIMPKLIYFVIIHPSTYLDFLPVQRKNKYWIIDSNMCLLYLILISIIVGYFLIN